MTSADREYTVLSMEPTTRNPAQPGSVSPHMDSVVIVKPSAAPKRSIWEAPGTKLSAHKRQPSNQPVLCTPCISPHKRPQHQSRPAPPSGTEHDPPSGE
ncbi:hypothetical protein F1880_006832 [Penicillium rolfsii]|nr:hypothetical protein F1880_006832 [Penicillium rolfsii]